MSVEVTLLPRKLHFFCSAERREQLLTQVQWRKHCDDNTCSRQRNREEERASTWGVFITSWNRNWLRTKRKQTEWNVVESTWICPIETLVFFAKYFPFGVNGFCCKSFCNRLCFAPESM
jgi:hypothetical protein